MPASAASSSHPAYVELADALQRFVEQGTLRAGQRIPSVREMARQRGVSPATVVKAYALLENREWIDARPQSGFYVRPRPAKETVAPRTDRPMTRASYVGVSDLAARVMTLAASPDLVQFGSGHPDSSLFPNRKLARLLGAIVRNDPLSLSRHSLNWGHEPLAREVARRYLKAGTLVSHEEMVITLGCTEALNLALRAVTRPGDTVALETPAYFGFLQIVQSLGLKVLEIPADPGEGMNLDVLRDALARKAVKAVMVMPSFNHPTGACMPDEKKARLHALLREFDVPAVEDDVYGDLHFDEARPRPLKSWDTDGRVLLCSSFDKTLAPGLRVGWCAPGRYLEPVRRLKLANTMGTPVVLQRAICDFLRTGGYDHHLRAMRRACRGRVERYAQAVLRTFPRGTTVRVPRGGYILWVELPVSVDALALHAEALRRKINFAPGPAFSVLDRYRNCLRLNCSLPWGERVREALQTLGGLASEQAPPGR